VMEIKRKDLPQDDEEADSETFYKPAENSRRLRSEPSNRILIEAGVPTIDVMVPFTRRTLCAIAHADSPESCVVNERSLEMVQTRVELAIQEGNVALENSGINGMLRLVHSYLADGYDEMNKKFSDILLSIAYSTDGVLDDIHALRAQYGADAVVMLVDNPASCGLSFGGAPVSKSWTFGVVNWICSTGYYSFVHEIAHFMGANHDRLTKQCPDPLCCRNDCYNFGFQDPLNRFRSIQSYDCPVEGGCPRVQYFSQPLIPYPLVADEGSREIPIGSNTHDNARIMNANFGIVAAYFAEVAVTPPTPAPSPEATCGNGVCEPLLYENCSTCPEDCVGGVYSGAECGNHICEAGENCLNCLQDCSKRLEYTSEDSKYCCVGGPSANLGSVQYGVSCGTYGYCNWNTLCNTKTLNPSSYCCGNGICELGEDATICSADCRCEDNGVCELFEDGSCKDCQDVVLSATKCMADGRLCNGIQEDPCCGVCNLSTRKCVPKP